VSSQSEGFCLSVIESLANGCPVVSYDINFGPRDMIKHGFNGYLAKDGNIQSLAENMSLMAQSSISSEDSKIQSSIVSFGEDSFIEKWFDLINKH
jgi:poly(glycerol-phosphate) alpha-glucosyltransferase